MDFTNPTIVPTVDPNNPFGASAGDIQGIVTNQLADQNIAIQQAAPIVSESMDLDAMLQAQYEAEMAKQAAAAQAALLYQQQQAALALQAAIAAQAAQAAQIQSIATLPTQADILAAQVAAAPAAQPVAQDLNAFLQQPVAYQPVANSVFIPSNVPQTGIIKNYTNYNYFYGKWSKGSAQRNLSEVWNAAGRTSDRGIATLNNRYLVAVSPKFGKVGDNIDVCLDNGVVIPCTIADAKGKDAKSEWGHTFGKAVDVIEWESMGGQSVINTDGWQGHKVDRIVNYTV